MSTINEFQEKIAESIQIIANSSVRASDAARTVEGTIISVVDVATNHYKMNYKDNEIDVYGSADTVYTPGDVVCAIVPEGDNANTKIILGAVSPSAEMIIEDNVIDDYLEIDNFVYDPTLYELCTYKSYEQKDASEDIISALAENFQKYLDGNSRDFKLSVSIKTNILNEQQSTGVNYGIVLKIPVLKDPGDGSTLWIEEDEKQILNESQRDQQVFTIDMNNIRGSALQLIEQSSQNLCFSIPENYTYDNLGDNEKIEKRKPKLYAFVEGFFNDESEEHENDIFIKNILLTAIHTFSEEEKSGTTLSIESSTGGYLFGGNSSITKILKPSLRVNGKTTRVENIYSCYWFVRDVEIQVGSDNYNILGGIGQRCLNDKTNITTDNEGNQSFQQVVNKYELEVKKKDVESSADYKCILAKENITPINAIVTIINRDSLISSNLKTDRGETSYLKDTGDVTLVGTLEWEKGRPEQSTSIQVVQERISKDGRYLSTDNFKTVDEEYIDYINPEDISDKLFTYRIKVDFPVSDIEDLNTINCNFYSVRVNEKGLYERRYLIRSSINITTDEIQGYRLVIQNGDAFYQYDANGNSPYSKDYALPTSINLKPITPVSFKIYKPDGVELSDAEYAYCKTTQTIPVNSLFKINNSKVVGDNYVITGTGIQEVSYEIEDAFNVNKYNNGYMLLNVIFGDITLNATANVTFSKDGDLGANGVNYAAIVTFNNHSYGEVVEDQGKKNLYKLQLGYLANEKSEDEEDRDDTFEAGWYYSEIPGQPLQRVNGPFNFNVEVYYINGGKANVDIKDISQSVFSSNDTNPVIQCENNQIILKPITDQTEDSVIHSCNIIQAAISVGNEGVAFDDLKPGQENNNRETIYAYYPIEVCYVRHPVPNTFQFPHIADGYNKVLYSSNAGNPQYDSTNPFRFVNSLENLGLIEIYDEEEEKKESIYEYTQGIIGEGNDEKKQNLEFSNSEEIHNTTCDIRPKTKYNNGEGLNGVKLTFNIKDSYINKIQELCNEAETKRDETKNEIDFLKESKDKLYADNEGTLYDKVNTLIININNKLKNKVNTIFLSKRTLCFNALEKAITLAKEAEAYLNQNDLSSTFYANYLTTIVPVRRQLQSLIVAEGKSFEKLKTIDENKYKTFFNIDKSITLKTAQTKILKRYIKNFNSIYKDYNSNLDDVNNNFINYRTEILEVFQNWFNEFDFNLIFNYENFGDQYNSIITRLYNPTPNFVPSYDVGTPAAALEEQKYIEELYPKEYPLYRNSSDIKNILKQIEELLKKNKVDKDFQRKWYENRITILEDKYIVLDEEYKEYSRLLLCYQNIQVVINKPVVLVLNRREFANLNGQDGSKLYIDETNGQYILAPQLGAGIKEDYEDPQTQKIEKVFTGLTMGIKTFQKSVEETNPPHLIGLFAFDKGQQTYFLNARDGSTIMGKAGEGQIIIDPNASLKGGTGSGLLYSSNYFSKYGTDGKPSDYTKITDRGMLINLTDAYIHFANDSSNPTDKGKPGKIYSGTHSTLDSPLEGFYLSKDGLSIGSSIRISSAEDGSILVGNLKSKGKHQIISGTAGDDSYAYIGYNADKLGFNFNENKIEGNSNSVYIGTDGIRLGTQFAVDNAGNMSAKNIKIKDAAEIGNQRIEKGNIVGNKDDGDNQIILDANGAIKSVYGEENDDYNQKINTSGDAYFNNIHCKQVFEIGDSSVAGSNYQSSSGNAFNFGMGSYGSIANGGFSLIGNGTTYGATGGLNMSATTTKVSGSSYGDNLDLATYIDKLVVDNVEIKNLLTYQNLDTAQQHKVVAKVNGTKTYTGSVSAGVVTITLPNVESTDLQYLGVDKDDNNSSSNP